MSRNKPHPPRLLGTLTEECYGNASELAARLDTTWPLPSELRPVARRVIGRCQEAETALRALRLGLEGAIRAADREAA